MSSFRALKRTKTPRLPSFHPIGVDHILNRINLACSRDCKRSWCGCGWGRSIAQKKVFSLWIHIYWLRTLKKIALHVMWLNSQGGVPAVAQQSWGGQAKTYISILNNLRTALLTETFSVCDSWCHSWTRELGLRQKSPATRAWRRLRHALMRSGRDFRSQWRDLVMTSFPPRVDYP